MNFRKILVFLSARSDWSAWDISPWFPNMGKELLYKLATCMMGLVSDYAWQALVFLYENYSSVNNKSRPAFRKKKKKCPMNMHIFPYSRIVEL